MAVLRLLSILSVFLAISNANLEPPTDTVPVQDAMGGKDYVIVVMDYFNLTENATANCQRAGETEEKINFTKQCSLVVESRLCFLDEKTMKVSDAEKQCVTFEGVQVWRGDLRGLGASSGHQYEKLSCLSWALGEEFKVFRAESQLPAGIYAKNGAVERSKGMGCIAWATTNLIDTETKSKIDRGYFQLSAKFSQIVGEIKVEAITDLLPMASQGFHLAPTRLHLAFYNGSPCKANSCTHLEFRFGVFTESGEGVPRANAAILKPRVKVYDDR